MAEKISGLTEATALAADDLLVCVDIDDTTMAPTGTNKNIQAQNLGLGAGTVVKQELGRLNAAVGGEFPFAGLDLSNYDRVILKCKIISSEASVADGLVIELNGVTTDPFRQADESNAGAGSSLDGADANIAAVPGASATNITYGDLTIEIESPGVAGEIKTVLCEFGFRYGATLARVGHRVVSFGITDAITAITLKTGSAATLSGRTILYGERTL